MKKKLKIVIIATILVFVCGHFIFFDKDSYFAQLRLKSIEASLHVEINRLNSENQKLKHDIDAIKDHEFFVEKVAREDFGLVKDRELIILFE